jgi:Ni/Fe-hydrogenase 1 B-type cytochrome subunit
MTTADLAAAPKKPAAAPAPAPELPNLEPVYIWQAPVRATHWLIFFSMAFLVGTGIYIGNPFSVGSGPASDHFLMGWIRAIHFWAAIVFTLSVLSRIVWMFVGNRYSKWWQFIPVHRRRRAGMLGTLKFYLLLRDHPPGYHGHNPLAGAAYSLVFLLYLVMITTGLGLYAMSAHVDSPFRFFEFFLGWFGGAQSARWIHHVVMWLLIGFVAHHVWSAFLVSRVERNGTLDSIFSGFKYLRHEDPDSE